MPTGNMVHNLVLAGAFGDLVAASKIARPGVLAMSAYPKVRPRDRAALSSLRAPPERVVSAGAIVRCGSERTCRSLTRTICIAVFRAMTRSSL